MAETLKELYNAFYNPANQENAEALSEQLCEFYETPDAISAALQILNEPDLTMKKRVSVGLKMIINSNVEFLKQNGFAELKGNLLELCTPETDLYIMENISEAVGAIICKDENDWPEIVECSSALLQCEQVNGILNGLHLSLAIIKNVNDEAIPPLVEQLFPLINTLFTSDNEDIVTCSAKILSTCFEFNPELGEALLEPFNQFIATYTGLLTKGAANFSNIDKMSVCIKDIFESEFIFEDAEPYLKAFIEELSDESIDPQYKQYPLDIAATILTRDATMSEHESEYLAGAITFCASAFHEGETYDQQELIPVFEEAMTKMCLACSKQEYANTVLGLVKETESPSEAYVVAFASALSIIVTEGWEVAANSSSQILEFAIQLIHYEGENEATAVCVIESGLELLMSLFQYSDPGFAAVQEDVLGVCTSALGIDDATSLHIRALKTISALFGSVDIDSQLLQPTLELLVQLAQADNHEILMYIIDAFGDIVESAKEQITQFTGDIVQILLEAAGLDEPEDAAIKAAAISSLGTLVPYVEERAQFFEFFTEACASDDVQIATAGFEALLIGLKYIPEGFDEQFSSIMEVTMKILETVIEYKDSTDSESENEKMERIMFTVLNFVRKGVIHYHDVFAPFLEEIFTRIDTQIKQENNMPTVVGACIEAGIPVRQAINPDITEFVKEIAEKIGEEEPVTTSIYRALAKALNREAVIEPETLAAIIDLSFPGLEHQFDFQEQQDDLNYNDFESILVDFFATVATKAKEIFPLDKFLSAIKAIYEGDNNLFKSDIIRALAAFFEAAHGDLQVLHKKEIMRFFVEAMDICSSFDVFPGPISAVIVAVECEPEAMAQHAGEILEKVSQLLQGEETENVFYRQTLTSLVALLFSIFKNIMKGEFPCDTFMETMLGQFPCSGDESNTCYSSLVAVCSEFPEIMGPYGVLVSVALAKTLGLRDHLFKELGITQDVFLSICILFNNLVANNSAATAAIDEALADQEGAQDRINARLEQAANQISPEQ